MEKPTVVNLIFRARNNKLIFSLQWEICYHRLYELKDREIQVGKRT